MGYYRPRSLSVYPIAIGVVFAGILGVSVIKSCQYVNNEDWQNLDEKVRKDLGANFFMSQSVTIDVSGQNNYIKLVGIAEKGGTDYDYAEAKYQITDANLAKIMPNINKSESTEMTKEVEKMSQEFLQTLLQILQESTLVDSKFIEELAINEGGNVVLNVGNPVVNEEHGLVSYAINILKTNGTTFKIGTIKIEAPLDDELKKDARNIYLRDKKQCRIQVMGVQTFEDVQRANLIDQYLILDGNMYVI